MIKRLLPLVVVVLAAIGSAGLTPRWPAAGVGFCAVFTFAAFLRLHAFNVPITRFLFLLAPASLGGALWHATNNVALVVGTILANVVLLPWPFVALRWPVRGTIISDASALTVSGVALLLAWPGLLATSIGWGFALLPACVIAVGGLIVGIQVSDELQGKTLRKQLKLKIGEPMPELKLPMRGGGEFELSEAKGSGVILCYLRGDWCPVCHVFMRLFKKEAPRLAALGIKLVAISPTLRPEADGFMRDLGLEYTFLVDEKARTAAKWGLLQRAKKGGEEVPLPVALLIDKSGILRFVTNPHDMTPFQDQVRLMELAEGTLA